MAIQDGTLLIFGIDTPNQGYGLLQSYEQNTKMKRATAIAPDGEVVSIQEYGREDELTVTFLPLSNGSTDSNNPIIGATFQFNGSTYYVNSIAETRTVDGFMATVVDASTYNKVF